MQKWKKNILNALFIILLLSLTFYGLFKGQDLDSILTCIYNAKKTFLYCGAFFVVLFVCSESIIIYYLFSNLKTKVNFGRCILYSFIGFFYASITPSSSGGQPAQLYYMNKDNISITISTLVLMIVTITYKAVLVVLGVYLILFRGALITQYLGSSVYIFYIGFFLNVFAVTSMLLFVFHKNLSLHILKGLFFLLDKVKWIKKKEQKKQRIMNSVLKYFEASAFYKSNMIHLLNVLIMTFVQRILLFFVTYLVYLSLGLHGYSMIDIILLQSVISITVEMLPIPGGIGLSEKLFLDMFTTIFGATYVMPGLLISRSLNYYFLLIITATVTIFTHMHVAKREKRN